MAVNWNLGGQGFNALEALQSFGAAQQQRQQQEQYAQQQQAIQQRRQVGGMAASGDFAGARRTAASNGDFGLLGAIGNMESDKLEKLNREFDVIGQLHPQLKGLPAEARAAVATPILAQAGFSPDELAQVDWSDQGIDAVYSMSQAGKAALASRMKAMEPYTLAPGSRRYAGTEVIADNPASEKPIWDAESGQLIYPSAYAQGGGAPQQSMPPMGAGGAMGNMLAITAQSESGNRDFTNDGRLVTSPKGAQGAMQTMPMTQRDPGFGVAPARDGSVGEKNRVGRDYLDAMVQRYGGDPAKAWAAYNAGPGRVDAAIQQGGENWLARLPSETRAYVQKNTAALGGGRRQASDTPGVVQVRPPRQREQNAPSGYRFNGDRLEPIPGGPADKAGGGAGGTQNNRKAEADFRKEFHALPEVKEFNKVRPQFNTLRDLVRKPNPTAQDDIAIIFNYMKLLDPTSVVREGEFATAQNASGIPDNIRNMFNRAQDGTRLNPDQRRNLLKTAYGYYKNYRQSYNTQAEQYRGYAQDNGVDPNRVARTYTPDKAPARSSAPVSSMKKGETRKIGNLTVTAVD